jgi:putative flippase GtrA
VYALLLYLGINYAVSNLAALIAGILFSFKTQGKFVFNNSDDRLLWRFVLFWVLLYGFNVMSINTAMKFGLNAYLAGALTLIPNAMLSYLAQRRFVFIPVHP